MSIFAIPDELIIMSWGASFKAVEKLTAGYLNFNVQGFIFGDFIMSFDWNGECSGLFPPLDTVTAVVEREGGCGNG